MIPPKSMQRASPFPDGGICARHRDLYVSHVSCVRVAEVVVLEAVDVELGMDDMEEVEMDVKVMMELMIGDIDRIVGIDGIGFISEIVVADMVEKKKS
jgi:hypothetical protein